MIHQHKSVSETVNDKSIDVLISQMLTTPMPGIRKSALRHLYSIGAQLKQIADAYEVDLEAGDRILNAKSHDEQNRAPETKQWLAWLKSYESAYQQLARISDALAGVESEAA